MTEQALEFIGGPLDGNKTTDTPDPICIYMTGHGTDGKNRHARYDYDGHSRYNFVGWTDENEELII